MSKVPWLIVLRVAALVALCAAAALLSDYTSDAPTFCSASSGCGAVRQHVLSHIQIADKKFIPLPLLGVLGFIGLFAASFVALRFVRVAAIAGGVVASYLLYVQAHDIGHFCWLCVSTDVSALVAAGASLALSQQGWDEGLRGRLQSWSWWSLAGLALSVPLVWPRVKAAPPVPPAVLALYKPGKINVVEFADFQCPACRYYAPILKHALEGYGDRVSFVRLNKPLEMHQYARDAARAYVCGKAQGVVEPMADALFAASDLTPAGIDKVAQQAGLDANKFEACMIDPATDARVQHESDMLVPPELEGLPTTYIGGKRFLGVQTEEVLKDALDRRSATSWESHGVPGYVYLPLVVALALLIVRRGSRPSLT